MRKTKGERIYAIVCIAICSIVAIVSLYPMLYAFFVSLATKQELTAKGGAMVWFPAKPTLAAYKTVLSNTGFVFRSAQITLARTILGTLLSISTNAFAGYALSRKNLPGRKVYMAVLLVPILFSGGLLPNYLTMQSLHLLNSFWVMVFPMVFNAFNILIFKQFFEGIPPELEDAAQVDGVNEFQLFVKIILPMSKPVLAAITLFTVVGHWNSWFDAFLYIGQQHSAIWPLQTYIMLVFNNLYNLPELSQLITAPKDGAEEVAEISTRMALTLLATTPILVIFPIFQKYFTRGVYMGAVKG